MELRNAKFLENDLASGNDLSSEKEQSFTSSERLVIIQNIPRVQMGVVRPISEDQHTIVSIFVDHVFHEVPDMVEQPARQHDPHGNDKLTLRRSSILDDYIVYLQ